MHKEQIDDIAILMKSQSTPEIPNDLEDLVMNQISHQEVKKASSESLKKVLIFSFIAAVYTALSIFGQELSYAFDGINDLKYLTLIALVVFSLYHAAAAATDWFIAKQKLLR